MYKVIVVKTITSTKQVYCCKKTKQKQVYCCKKSCIKLCLEVYFALGKYLLFFDNIDYQICSHSTFLRVKPFACSFLRELWDYSRCLDALNLFSEGGNVLIIQFSLFLWPLVQFEGQRRHISILLRGIEADFYFD